MKDRIRSQKHSASHRPAAALGLVAAGLALLGLLGLAPGAGAHCQVPCGIYDDPARIQELREDAATISKAVAKIRELSSKHDPQAFNQSVRWTNTKEMHASHIITVVAEYFLAQKVRPVASDQEGYKEYLINVGEHHAVMRAAMATKQQVSAEAVRQLEAAIEKLAKRYP